jgi:surfeit locus 1 family protein
MTIKFPLIPTIIVAVAVATMIGLGIWQLQRKAEKEIQIALYHANMKKPAMAFPKLGPLQDAETFRRSSLVCLDAEFAMKKGGKDIEGQTGILNIVRCKTGADGPGVLVALGIAKRPDFEPGWTSGTVTGMIVPEPNSQKILGRWLDGPQPLGPMLIADQAPEGLTAAAKPNPDTINNNHLFYAIQWFFFAAAAAVIYILALKRKQAGL